MDLGGVGAIHVDDFLLGALIEKGEEGASHPVHAEDVDGEAFCEIVPVGVSESRYPVCSRGKEAHMLLTPSLAYWHTPALLISTSSPLPDRSASTSAAACFIEASLVTSRLTITTRSDDFLASSTSSGASPRAVAKTLATSEAGREMSWRASARPKPLLAPVMRYEAIVLVGFTER